MDRSTPYRIGLTGNIATGKTTVGRMLVELGAELIDADRVAHSVMVPGGPAYAAVVRAFGPEILTPEGDIDRAQLGDIVFSDPAALARLEALVHPPTLAEIERRVAASDAPVVVVEAIKLLESGTAGAYDAIWVATCSYDTQLARLVENRGMRPAEARRRIAAQPPPAEKIARADVVIDTDVPLAQTRAQVTAAWRRIHRRIGTRNL